MGVALFLKRCIYLEGRMIFIERNTEPGRERKRPSIQWLTP